MASARQINANRRNAPKGGPKTSQGRAAVRFNALAHGLAAVETVLPGEDANAFQELQASLIQDFAPANGYERGLAEEVARCYWRLLRLRGIETAMLSYHIEARQKLAAAEDKPEPAPDRAIAEALTNEPYESFRNYFRYDAGIERSYYRALQQIERAQAIRRKTERELTEQQPLTTTAGSAGSVSGSGIGTVLHRSPSPFPLTFSPCQPLHLVAATDRPQNCGQDILYNRVGSV